MTFRRTDWGRKDEGRGEPEDGVSWCFTRLQWTRDTMISVAINDRYSTAPRAIINTVSVINTTTNDILIHCNTHTGEFISVLKTVSLFSTSLQLLVAFWSWNIFLPSTVSAVLNYILSCIKSVTFGQDPTVSTDGSPAPVLLPHTVRLDINITLNDQH